MPSLAIRPRIAMQTLVRAGTSARRVARGRSMPRGGVSTARRPSVRRAMSTRCETVGTAADDRASVRASRAARDDSGERYVYVGNLDFFDDPADVRRYLAAALARATPASPSRRPSRCRAGDRDPASTRGRGATRASSTGGSRCWSSRTRTPAAPPPRRSTARSSTAGRCGPARGSRSRKTTAGIRATTTTAAAAARTKPPRGLARNDARTTGGSDADVNSATPPRWGRGSRG